MDQHILQQLVEKFPGFDCRLDDESLQQYGTDWTQFHKVNASAIIFPRSEFDLQWLVKFAREHKIALVPSGGRTGLSAGAVATQGEVVVSLERLDQILEFNSTDATLRVQAGVITATIQDYAEQQGMFYPVDFASSGSSHIGGNVATNAGGIRVIRYGMTRDQVVGLRVVTAKGEILSLNKGLIKNATGMDLRHLFIGSEGALGFITEVTLKLINPPGPQSVLVLGLEDLSAVMPVLESFRKELTLSAFEFFSDQALNKVMAHQKIQQPFETRTAFYALIEVDVEKQGSEDALLSCFEYAFEQGWIVDGVMSSSAAQAESLWKLREGISESITPWTPYKYDISVTTSKVAEFLLAVDNKVSVTYPDFENIWFGHIGDGNLHLNILKPEKMAVEKFKETCLSFSNIIYGQVAEFGGSISAEHGIGLLKKSFLHFSRSPEEINIQKAIKKLFDPDNILNPGKIF
ncbi:MAG: FAD-binding oxidoreductase [Gammaproteobacteria bacterium]|nr:MAG: FAD-binding oxidoreductase [Gammaproteobacteria bacterium]